MRVGTKSVLFGAHCFLLHSFFVAAAWWTLYGFPRDLRLWVAFFVHDIGYIGKPNMDGAEGETHVELGARIMRRLFDRKPYRTERIVWGPAEGGAHWQYNTAALRPWLEDGWFVIGRPAHFIEGPGLKLKRYHYYWSDFCRYHSRFYAKRDGVKFSRLCVADKLSICLTPWWLYLPMVNASGEVHEYIAKVADGKYSTMNVSTASQRVWYKSMQDYLRRWVEEHKDGRDDTWTPAQGAK